MEKLRDLKTSLNDFEISVPSVPGYTHHIFPGNFIYYKYGTGSITIEDTKNQSRFSLYPGQSVEVAEYKKLIIYSDYSDKKVITMGYGKMSVGGKPDYIDVLERENFFIAGSYNYSGESEYPLLQLLNPIDSGIICVIDRLNLSRQTSGMFRVCFSSIILSTETEFVNINDVGDPPICQLRREDMSTYPSTNILLHNIYVHTYNDLEGLNNRPIILNSGNSLMVFPVSTSVTGNVLFEWQELPTK